MKDKTKSEILKQKANSVFMFVGGIIIVVIAGFCALACTIAGLIPMTVFFLIFVVLGILFIKNANTRKKLIADYRKYVAIISEDQSNSIENLANKLGENEQTVKEKLNRMITMGFFTNAAIDETSNSIVFGSHFNSNNFTANSQNGVNIKIDINGDSLKDNSSNEPKYIVVECKGCGAKAKIKKGEVANCEYCGSPISDDSNN